MNHFALALALHSHGGIFRLGLFPAMRWDDQMYEELRAAAVSAKAAFEIIKGINALSSEIDLNLVKIELQQCILDCQRQIQEAEGKYNELVEVKRQADQKLVDYLNWKDTAAKYQLLNVEGGAFVYALKAEHCPAEPFHWICPRCYESQKKSILQPAGLGGLEYECECTFKAKIRKAAAPAPYKGPPGPFYSSQ